MYIGHFEIRIKAVIKIENKIYMYISKDPPHLWEKFGIQAQMSFFLRDIEF